MTIDSRKYIELIYPNGRAFNSVEDSLRYKNVLAMQVDRAKSWLQYFQDQLWYVNENFDPEPWEIRYDIDVSELATLQERRQIVKSYMSFPTSNNMLSLDYIQAQLILAGFTDVVISNNETGTPVGKLHGNNITSTENYTIGSKPYNSLIISGTVQSYLYEKMLLLIMSLKSLDTVIYDTVIFYQSLAIDENLTLAIDENLTLAINTI